MKRKANKREMLSYEDKPIEEYEREERKRELEKATKQKNKADKNSILPKGKLKIMVIIGILLVVVVTILGLWKYIAPNSLKSSIFSSAIQGNGFPIDIQGHSVDESDICILNNNFAYLSDTQFQVINASGGVVKDKRIKYASPAMKSSGDYCIIYDREGNGFEISTSTETITEGQVDDDIFSADINKKGAYAIISKKTGYTAKLTAFGNDNKQKYAYYFSECYATSVSINEASNKAVVCGLYSDKGKVMSRIYVLDFSKEEPVAKIDLSGEVIYCVSFMSNGNIAAVGETSSVIITSDYKNKFDFTYNDYNIRGKIITDDSIVLSMSPFTDGRSCELWRITQSGFSNVTQTPLAISSMTVKGNVAAVLSNNKISTYNLSTQTGLFEYDAGIDAQSLLLTDDNIAYVIGISEIRKIKIK